MELRQLRYFITVADTRSFVSAASRLFISRQAISKAISQLETELQTELFMRDCNGAFLTPAGILFYERVRNILLDLDQLTAQMQEQNDRFHQRLRLVFSPGMLQTCEAALCAYSEVQTNVDISYTEYSDAECIEKLRQREAELAITGQDIHDVAISTMQICSSPVGLLSAMPNPHWGDPEQVYACLEDSQLLKAFSAQSLSPRYCGYDRERLFNLVQDHKCVLLVPQQMAPLRRDLFFTPLPDLPEWKIYCSYLRNDAKSDLFRTVVDSLLLQLFGNRIHEKNLWT